MSLSRGPEPEVLRSELVKLAIQKMREFYHSENRSQRRYDFPFNKEIDALLIAPLRTVFHDKCGYCEKKVDPDNDGIVDRFRPHDGIRDKDNYLPDCYWWLTFEWDNLFYCCKDCAQYKASYFPIAGKRALTEKDELLAEKCLLFDPFMDNWNNHLSGVSDEIESQTTKGAQTISLLRLNRADLKTRRGIADEQRRKMYFELVPVSDLSIRYLSRIYHEDYDIEFLYFQRDKMLRELHNSPGLYESLFAIMGIDRSEEQPGRDKAPALSPTPLLANDYFPIEWMRIKDFKGITDLTIEFKPDEPGKKSWLFLLGENGVGKSSILQAMAVGMQVDRQAIGFVSKLIRKGAMKAEITIKERNSDNLLITTLTREKITQTGGFNSFLMGYGSLRLSGDEAGVNPEEDQAKVSYENLFKPVRPLNDITQWLKDTHQRNPMFFDAIAYSIKQLLPHDFAENELTVNEEIMFKNSEKQFSELSDGFKSTIILAVDIMMKLSSAQADMDKMTGIVLIDELGNQLHPRWQMRIVQQLRAVFPNLNFIVSTHHPLCLRGSEAGEILLLKNVDNTIVPITELPDPTGLRVDQILASEFFGLSSMIDPALEAKFNRYYALLAKEKELSKEEQAELFRLKDELREQKHLGDSLREELMYYAIDSLLASKLAHTYSRGQLKEQVVTRVKEIWEKLNSRKHDQG